MIEVEHKAVVEHNMESVVRYRLGIEVDSKVLLEHTWDRNVDVLGIVEDMNAVGIGGNIVVEERTVTVEVVLVENFVETWLVVS